MAGHRLVLTAHWTTDESDVALDRVTAAYAPLKAEGTVGTAIVAEGDNALTLMTQIQGWAAQ